MNYLFKLKLPLVILTIGTLLSSGGEILAQDRENPLGETGQTIDRGDHGAGNGGDVRSIVLEYLNLRGDQLKKQLEIFARSESFADLYGHLDINSDQYIAALKSSIVHFSPELLVDKLRMVRDALNFDDGTIVFNEKTALEGIDTLEFTILFHHEHLNLLGIEIGSFEESIKLLPFIEKGDVVSNFRLKSKIIGNTFQVNKWLGEFTRLSGDFSDARSGNEYRDLKRRCDGYRVLIEKLIDRNPIAINGYDENTALKVVRENELKRSCPVTVAGRCTKYYFNFTCQVALINLEDRFTFFEEAYYFDGMSCPEAQARFRAYVSQTKKADIFWQHANYREPETYKMSRKLRRELGIKEKYGCRVVVNSIKSLY